MSFLIVGWTFICVVLLRVLNRGVGPHGISDERRFYVLLSADPHPICATDYHRLDLYKLGKQVRNLARRNLVMKNGWNMNGDPAFSYQD